MTAPDLRCPADGCRRRHLEQLTDTDWRCPRCLRGYIDTTPRPTKGKTK